MLGLLLIYFIGKRFYELADANKKSPYLFGILGVAAYYIGSFVFGIILALIIGADAVVEMNDILAAFVALPAGLISCYLFYKFLENRWTKFSVSADPEILDDFNV